MAKKKTKNKNSSPAEDRRREVKPVSCPECGKKFKPRKDNFCPACGREVFSPSVSKKWSIKVFLAIVVATAVFYLVYLLLKDPIYYWLDKVPHR